MAHDGRALRIAFAVLGVLGLAGAVAISLLPLPQPGLFDGAGTCGPGSASDPAIVGFFARSDTFVSGPSPQPGSDLAQELQSFEEACKSEANSRMLVALVVFAVSLFVAFAAPPLVGRMSGGPSPAGGPPPGWYDDPLLPGAKRWWDGTGWGPSPP